MAMASLTLLHFLKEYYNYFFLAGSMFLILTLIIYYISNFHKGETLFKNFQMEKYNKDKEQHKGKE